MRSLGYALLVVSVLFSAGGVSVRAADSAAPEASAPAPVESQESASCEIPELSTVRTIRIDPLVRATRGATKSFVLNTRGFNYTRPGSLPVLPPSEKPGQIPTAEDSD